MTKLASLFGTNFILSLFSGCIIRNLYQIFTKNRKTFKTMSVEVGKIDKIMFQCFKIIVYFNVSLSYKFNYWWFCSMWKSRWSPNSKELLWDSWKYKVFIRAFAPYLILTIYTQTCYASILGNILIGQYTSSVKAAYLKN